MRIATGILSVILIMAPAMDTKNHLTRDQAVELGRADLKRFLAGQTHVLWSAMSEAMRSGLKTEDALIGMSKQISSQFGAVESTLHEDALPAPGDLMVYTRVVKFQNYPMPLVVLFTFGQSQNIPARAKDDKIAASIEGFYIRPEPNPAQSSFLAYEDKTKLHFPLEGTWTVYQGGRSVAENYHAASPDERFAYDLVVLKGDRLYAGDGATNEDWFSFSQPVRADAAGKVSFAQDLYADNPPLKPNPGVPQYGNSIVIDHGNGECTMYAHLKHGSLKVTVGDTVESSQQIALTGNSGNSPFSRLHYHLQNTATWFKGDGLPVRFQNVEVNGRPATIEPIRGDNISAAK